MFQYASARGIASSVGAQLVVDKKGGFARDKLYQRKYELGTFAIKGRPMRAVERLALTFEKIRRKVISEIEPFASLAIAERMHGVFIDDDNRGFEPAVFRNCRRTTYLRGYWQSHLYFQHISSIIRTELLPAQPTNARYRETGEFLRSRSVVALGIRLYEESRDPSAHAHLGRIKSADSIAVTLAGLLERIPDAIVAVFCTHRAGVLSELSLPANAMFITGDDGYTNAVETLWLLAQCQHHVFTNSSFYWWGAYLSGTVHAGDTQLIYAADNFINQSAYLAAWSRF